MSIYYLYWIHFSHHTDPFRQGYIGQTINPESRFRTHTLNGSAILKESIGNGARMGLLYEVNNKRDVGIIETFYRPRQNIGWNKAKGGSGGYERPKMLNRLTDKVYGRTKRQELLMSQTYRYINDSVGT